MGPRRTEFDSQRLDYLLRMVSGGLHLERFSYVSAGALPEDVALTPELVAADCDCSLGYAILELV